MKRYAKTIVKVLIAYKDIVKEDFKEHLDDERIVSAIQSSLYSSHFETHTFDSRL